MVVTRRRSYEKSKSPYSLSSEENLEQDETANDDHYATATPTERQKKKTITRKRKSRSDCETKRMKMHHKAHEEKTCDEGDLFKVNDKTNNILENEIRQQQQQEKIENVTRDCEEEGEGYILKTNTSEYTNSSTNNNPPPSVTTTSKSSSVDNDIDHLSMISPCSNLLLVLEQQHEDEQQQRSHISNKNSDNIPKRKIMPQEEKKDHDTQNQKNMILDIIDNIETNKKSDEKNPRGHSNVHETHSNSSTTQNDNNFFITKHDKSQTQPDNLNFNKSSSTNHENNNNSMHHDIIFQSLLFGSAASNGGGSSSRRDGNGCIHIFDELSRIVDAAILDASSSLPFISSSSGGRKKESTTVTDTATKISTYKTDMNNVPAVTTTTGEETFCNLLRQSYQTNMDKLELYAKRNIFRGPKRRALKLYIAKQISAGFDQQQQRQEGEQYQEYSLAGADAKKNSDTSTNESSSISIHTTNTTPLLHIPPSLTQMPTSLQEQKLDQDIATLQTNLQKKKGQRSQLIQQLSCVTQSLLTTEKSLLKIHNNTTTEQQQDKLDELRQKVSTTIQHKHQLDNLHEKGKKSLVILNDISNQDSNHKFRHDLKQQALEKNRLMNLSLEERYERDRNRIKIGDEGNEGGLSSILESLQTNKNTNGSSETKARRTYLNNSGVITNGGSDSDFEDDDDAIPPSPDSTIYL